MRAWLKAALHFWVPISINASTIMPLTKSYSLITHFILQGLWSVNQSQASYLNHTRLLFIWEGRATDCAPRMSTREERGDAGCLTASRSGRKLFIRPLLVPRQPGATHICLHGCFTHVAYWPVFLCRCILTKKVKVLLVLWFRDGRRYTMEM